MSGLIALPVELEEIDEALDEPPASESYIDIGTGMLWPAQLFDVDQGPDDFDEDDSERWLLVAGFGSSAAYEVMQRFISTIEPSDMASRLTDVIVGSGAFRRFESELQQDEDQYTCGIDPVTTPVSAAPAPGLPTTATDRPAEHPHVTGAKRTDRAFRVVTVGVKRRALRADRTV